VVPDGSFERLREIANATFADIDGRARPLLGDEEVRWLSLRKGSLSEWERQQIEAHVLHTYRFLHQIPWTTEIRRIPAIALGHHEKLNGTGYPYKLSAADIPIQTRMMTISDIFDALSAADRPYKKAIPVERALDILKCSVKDGELDAGLFDLFLEARVYDRWLVESHPY
jgi:HD-GYP domain-containing protein (c-di-GMP phosphodiesterase class II)